LKFHQSWPEPRQSADPAEDGFESFFVTVIRAGVFMFFHRHICGGGWLAKQCLAVAIAAIHVFGCAAQENVPGILLTNVNLVDVESGTSAGIRQVMIRGQRIAWISERIDNLPGDATVLDLEGKYLLPGLIDLHSHLLLRPYNEASWNDQVLKESLELRVIRGTLHARQNLEAGFTTIRDLGTEGAAFADVALRDAIHQGLIRGPRVFAVTKALVTTGGYGPSGFDPRFELPKGAQTADGVAQVRRATREQIAAGADWIKVYADYRRKEGDTSTPTFSQEELDAIVNEATSAGLRVAAHATTDEGIRRAVNAGVATIEHGYEASVDTLKLMRERNVVLCPTLAASEAMALYSGWMPNQPDHPRIATARQLMKNALATGVSMACGSDVGVFAHGTNIRELELMYAWGMPAADVVKAATIDAARVLQRERQLGRIAPEYLADLIVVDGNPLEDISTLRRPLIVIKDGVIELNHLR
jgi:imidazolonepropionase-like amidohydrolase